MRKMFDEDFSLEELKHGLKKMKKKDCSDTVIAVIAAIGIIAVIAAGIYAILKLTQHDFSEEDEMFGEDFEDEDGVVYAREEDFE